MSSRLRRKPEGAERLKEVRVTDDERLRERFGALFRQTYPELCSFVMQVVRSRAVAEELVQDLFLRLWERRTSWHEELPSRSYLYQAARHRAWDALRHERIVERSHLESADDGEAVGPAAEEELGEQDLRAALAPRGRAAPSPDSSGVHPLQGTWPQLRRDRGGARHLGENGGGADGPCLPHAS